MTPSSSGRIAFFHDAYTGSIPVGVNYKKFISLPGEIGIHTALKMPY